MEDNAVTLLARLLWISGATASKLYSLELAYALITVMAEEGYSIVKEETSV